MMRYCVECVLSPEVPGVVLDEAGVCNVCAEYAENREAYDAYFKAPGDFHRSLGGSASGAEYDCLLLYSGGKDSTYVLYDLVDRGHRVLAYTFDNGYISPQCFDNIRAVCASLGVTSVIGSLPKRSMDRIFSVSLQSTATVCWGCFRSLTSLGSDVARHHGIRAIVTGLSRGQIFETKVHPLLRSGIRGVGEIERHLEDFREAYESIADEAALLIDAQRVAPPGDRPTFFLDYFRYHDVSTREIAAFLRARAPVWRRPDNVGSCSTNCMINDLGIAVHEKRKGYHHYVVPLSWDIRFDHIDRPSALADVTARLDDRRLDAIARRLERG